MTTIAMTALIGLILICIINTAALVYTVSKFRKAQGSFTSSTSNTERVQAETAPAPRLYAGSAPEINAEEMARARKKFQDEMDAFQELMNYNQNKAYGIEPTSEE